MQADRVSVKYESIAACITFLSSKSCPVCMCEQMEVGKQIIVRVNKLVLLEVVSI